MRCKDDDRTTGASHGVWTAGRVEAKEAHFAVRKRAVEHRFKPINGAICDATTSVPIREPEREKTHIQVMTKTQKQMMRKIIPVRTRHHKGSALRKARRTLKSETHSTTISRLVTSPSRSSFETCRPSTRWLPQTSRSERASVSAESSNSRPMSTDH